MTDIGQSEGLNSSVVQVYAESRFIGSGPQLKIIVAASSGFLLFRNLQMLSVTQSSRIQIKKYKRRVHLSNVCWLRSSDNHCEYCYGSNTKIYN